MSTDEPIRRQGRLVRIGSLESDGFNGLNDPERCIRDLKVRRSGIDIFTFVQTLPNTERLFPYPMELDNFAALPVTTFDNWWTGQIDFKVRNKARKGGKTGLVVREVAFDEDFVRGISAIYNETPIRQGKKFWHYQKDIETVRRQNATFLSQSILIGAFVGAELVGFVKLVVDEAGGQAAVMQILAMIRHRDKAPTNALIAQAVRSCAERRIPNLVYAKLSYGKKHQDSLAAFKLGNGFQRIDVPRYYVPVTRRGRLAMSLGLHRGLSERVPESVLAKYREWRGLWYAHRFPHHSASA